jgi:hypothetical protein
MIRCLVLPLTAVVVVAMSAMAQAQSSSPGPTRQRVATDDQQEACKQGFEPLQQEAKTRGELLKAASARHAPAAEVCKLIGDFIAAEVKMIRFVETYSAPCEVTSKVRDQLKAGRATSERLQERVCAAASSGNRWPGGSQTTDFGNPAFKQR